MLRDLLASFAALASALLLVETASAQVASTSASLAKSTRAGQTITVDGIAEFRQGDTLVVSGYRIQSSTNTKFTGKDIPSLSAVPLGFRVEAKGVVQPNGT